METMKTSEVRSVLSLNGKWSFALDAEEQLTGDAVSPAQLDSHIEVPGSWEEQGFGELSKHDPIGAWKKLREYVGVGWYSKEITVPEHLSGRSYRLILSGVRWKSQVWLDGQSVGEHDSLVSEHCFDLTPNIKPGQKQMITVRLDNRMILPLAESHIHSYHTSTMWGGITGGARIEVLPLSRIESVYLVPDARDKTVSVDMAFTLAAAESEEASSYAATVEIQDAEGNSVSVKAVPIERTSEAGADGAAAVSLYLGAEAVSWSDRNPYVYDAVIRLQQEGTTVDERRHRFGLRTIETEGKRIILNGSPVYMRGYVDCCIFPQTGYPVWSEEHYRRQFQIARSYGFNHVRLHGWTAPAPFWRAADSEGMLVQAELPHWSNWYNPREGKPPEGVHEFLKRELERIIRTLNEHPSFVMLSLGNELVNEQGHPGLNEMVNAAREQDASRLYTDNTGFGDLPALDREGDYYIPTLNWHTPHSIDYAASPDSYEDYEAVAGLSDVPVIAHEHGQFTMYVRPSEESKYTGVLRPNWLRTTMETLESKQMVSRIPEFTDASGTLLVRSLKETMERIRRTPSLSGIQLLDIRDFPGQGHATTGILDVFWDSKGLIEPEEFRSFNDATVLVMRAQGRTFHAGETLDVLLECSHYGAEPIREGVLHWELTSSGKSHGSGTITSLQAEPGSLGLIGKLPLSVHSDCALTLELRTTLRWGGQQVSNSWELWVYPRPRLLPEPDRIWTNIQALKPALPGSVFKHDIGVDWLSYREEKDIDLAITDQLSRYVLQYVLDGGSAWLMAKPGRLHDEVETKFLPIFWNYLWFPVQGGTTMGMVIHEHPLMSRFPHDGKSNWQWYHLVDGIPAIGLDALPRVRPIVEVVDNFNRAKKLAYAFEVRVGKGKLFVSSFRLSEGYDSKRPEAAHLFQQTVQYLRSEQFNPEVRLSVGELIGLFKLKNRP